MLSSNDFRKKQIICVFFNEGEKLAFKNENIIIKTKDDKIKMQCSCYRVYLILAIGHFSITDVVIQKTHKYGFFIALLTGSFRLYEIIGKGKDGNTMLKQKQYQYKELSLAKHITNNKIETQICTLKTIRNKNEYVKQSIESLKEYKEKLPQTQTSNEILAYEGLSAKLYFKAFFDNVQWQGRQPRIKRDYVNSVLDIGYTILFAFIESILLSFGFDTYCGVLHRQFYMRKSLVCDLVEPFRTIVDEQVKKSINLKQFKEEDFLVINYRYNLKWENSSNYIAIIMRAILNHKQEIFNYIQSYYRCFMKELSVEEFPFYVKGKQDDNN